MTMLGKAEGRKRVHKVLARSGYGKGGAMHAAQGAGSQHNSLSSYLSGIQAETHSQGSAPKKRMDRKSRNKSKH